MSVPAGRTLYKKKDGILTLTSNHDTVIWTPNTGGAPTVSLPLASITNLQQTPETAAKVMLKIIEKPPDGGAETSYLFHFNTSEAKLEASAVKELLSRLIANARSNDASIPRPSVGTPQASTPLSNGDGGGGSASASMAFASAVNSLPPAAKWFDENALKMDIELQQSLMKKDKSLHRTYVEAISTKPDTISGAAFNTQFWSTRTSLLRAHAIETNQRKGAYNVLSTIKPRIEDDKIKVNITVEQLQMIFAQHPLVKRIYDENVPRVSEEDFWKGFFASRLAKKLRGERVNDNDKMHPLFDKYDVSQNTVGFQSKIMAQSVPHIIDLEANEENQGGFKTGNAKDVEMRPRSKLALVETLNSLSERIMANVAPSDIYPPDSSGAHDMHSGLSLKDLQAPAQDNRLALQVKEQAKLFSQQGSGPSANAQVFSKQNPKQVLSQMQADITSLHPNKSLSSIDIQASLGFDPDSDSEDDDPEDGHKKPSHVNDRASLAAVEAEISTGLRQRRAQLYGSTSDSASSPMGLPTAIAEKCTLTHATTVEFLHQFWNAFLSGDPDRAAELQYLAESLKRSVTRIDAVAQEAESERAEIIKKRRAEIRQHFERTGKKIKWKSDSVGGGREAVDRLMAPTIQALQRARDEYGKALVAEGVQISTEG